MSGVLALGQEPRPLVADPLPTVPRTDAERFALDLEAQLATGNFASEERNLRRAFDDAAAALREAGAVVENPYEAGAWTGAFLPDLGRALGAVALPPTASLAERRAAEEERRRRELAWDQAVTRLREARPEEAERYLYTHEVAAMARRRAQNAAAEAAAAEGLGGGLGGFLGGMAGIFADPIQVMTLPLGAGRMAGGVLAQIGRTALIEGAVAGATQAVVETRAGPYRQSLGLPDGSLEQIGMAALGGAVIGGGLRALALGAERLRARLPPTDPARVAAQDAATLVQTRILDEAAAPGAPELVPAHEAALAAGIRRVETPEAPPVPELPPPVAPPAAAMRLAGLPEAELRAHVRGVVEELLTARGGSRADGAWRPDLGAITIEWGLPGDPQRNFRGGRGLAHIVAHRNAQGLDGEAWAREVLPQVLLFGQTANLRGPPDGMRVDLLWQGQRIVLALHRDGARENWILTGYPPERGPGGTAGGNPQPPYAPGPSVLQPREGAGPRPADMPPGARRFNAYTPTGRAVLVEPRVVSLRRLIPSHDQEGRPNPNYPHAEGLQPRDRAAAPSQDQVRAIAARLIPERLQPNVEAGLGAPIIGTDGVVESGNGRVAALMLIHRDPAFAAQRQAYLAMLERMGFDLTRIEEPVLVSARVGQMTPAERAAFVREANLRGTAAETATEMAARDAEAARAALPFWRGGTVDQAANREFLRRFLDRLTPEERSGLLAADGTPTPDLIQRVTRALLSAAYGDALGPVAARLIAGETEGIRGLAGALRSLAGDWAALRQDVAAGRIPAEYDATAALAEAVEAIAEAQQRRIPLADLVLQADFERPPMTPQGLAMLQAMFPAGDLKRRIKPELRLTEMLRGYVDRARAADAGPMLLPEARPSSAEMLGAAGRAEEGAARENPAFTPAQDAAGMLRAMRSPWPEQFPDVIAHGVQGIRRDPDWAAAKTGDAEAALRLVERLAKPEAAARLRQALGGEDALLVTVRQAERGGGDNLIPATFARWLSAQTGLAVDERILRKNRTMRTDANALQRLVRRAAFVGDVEPGRAYVIVDDVVTQGGTVADLRGYIEAKGGRVVAITALQAPGANARLAPSAAQIAALRARFGEAGEAWWKETFGHDFSGLTASEARQLFRFGNLQDLRSALEGAGALRAGPDDGRGGGGDAGPLPGGGAEGGGLFPRPQGGAGGGGAAGGPGAAGRGLAEKQAPPPAAEPQAARLLAADAEARRLAADPATRSAEVLEAQRIAAERDLPVPEETAQRGARELLDEAEAEAAEAAAAAACLTGGAA